jgi:hypothetical protein
MKRDKFHLQRFVRAANECYKYIKDTKTVSMLNVIRVADVLSELHYIDAVVPVVCRDAIPDLVIDFSAIWLINKNDAILIERTTFCKSIAMLIHYDCKDSLDKIIDRSM